MNASYGCGTCGKEASISDVEMPQIELWINLVTCVHTDAQVEHAVNANANYYPADWAGYDETAVPQESNEEASDG